MNPQLLNINDLLVGGLRVWGLTFEPGGTNYPPTNSLDKTENLQSPSIIRTATIATKITYS